MFWKTKTSCENASETIERKSVMEAVLAMSNSLSQNDNDSEALHHWYRYLEDLLYQIRHLLEPMNKLAEDPALQPFQLNRICDFLQDVNKRDLAGALYEIHVILSANKSVSHISREEMILVYMLLQIALNQFQAETVYSIKPCSSKVYFLIDKHKRFSRSDRFHYRIDGGHGISIPYIRNRRILCFDHIDKS